MAQRVAMHIEQAHGLAAEHVAAAARLDALTNELTRHMREAGTLTSRLVPYWTVAQLADLSADLRHDEADLAWRIDYLETSDRAFLQGSQLVDLLPAQRPAATMPVADAVALAQSLTDGPEVEPLERHLDDYVELMAALRSARYDEVWLARFFADLGPAATLQLSETLAVAGMAEVIAFGPPQADPAALHRTLADSIAIASNANGLDGRPLLDMIWFAELSAHGINGDQVDQAWIRLFDTTEPIRWDQRVHLAIVGLEIMDGQRHVDGPGTVTVDDDRWDVSPDPISAAAAADILLRSATENPAFAAQAILATTDNGRTGAQIIAGRSIDLGDQPNPLAPLAVAGTLDAQAEAIVAGVPINLFRAGQALEATGQLLAAIAAEERSVDLGTDGYDPGRVAAFTEIVTYSLPQILRSEYNADEQDHHRLLPGATVPSFDGGVRISANQLSLVLGVLFRDPTAQLTIGTAAELARRDLLLEDNSTEAHINAGELGGVVVNGLTRAGIQEAHAQAAAIAEFNDEADKIWGAFDFGIRQVGRKLPVVGSAIALGLTGYDKINDWAGAAGYDPEAELQDLVRGDGPEFENPTTVREATFAGADIRQDGQFNNNRLLLAVEFERMRSEFEAGTPSDIALALDDAIRSNPILAPHYETGVTTHADLATADPAIREELGEIAARLTHDEIGLGHPLRVIGEGFSRTHDGIVSGS